MENVGSGFNVVVVIVDVGVVVVVDVDVVVSGNKLELVDLVTRQNNKCYAVPIVPISKQQRPHRRQHHRNHGNRRGWSGQC